jgi:hypothetical protein
MNAGSGSEAFGIGAKEKRDEAVAGIDIGAERQVVAVVD